MPLPAWSVAQLEASAFAAFSFSLFAWASRPELDNRSAFGILIYLPPISRPASAVSILCCEVGRFGFSSLGMVIRYRTIGLAWHLLYEWFLQGSGNGFQALLNALGALFTGVSEVNGKVGVYEEFQPHWKRH